MSFPGRSLQRAWHIIDASTQTVGRLATTVAPLLKGKHKPTYRPNGDCGDYVVIVNAEKVRVFAAIRFPTSRFRIHSPFSPHLFNIFYSFHTIICTGQFHWKQVEG